MASRQRYVVGYDERTVWGYDGRTVWGYATRDCCDTLTLKDAERLLKTLPDPNGRIYRLVPVLRKSAAKKGK